MKRVAKPKVKARKKEGRIRMEGEGMIYFLGVIGAAVYYVQRAGDFWGGVIGILKAAIWPAFLIYELLKYLKM